MAKKCIKQPKSAIDSKIAFAQSKCPLDLIKLEFLYGVARVRQYGEKKHGNSENYLNSVPGDQTERMYRSSLMRHFDAVQQNIANVDAESGAYDLDQLIVNAYMLRSIYQRAGIMAQDPGELEWPPTESK